MDWGQIWQNFPKLLRFTPFFSPYKGPFRAKIDTAQPIAVVFYYLYRFLPFFHGKTSISEQCP